MSEYLSIQHIQKQFDAFTALKDISFTVKKNEFVCLLGPSGCGKTTLLRILAGLEETNDWQYSCEWKRYYSIASWKEKLRNGFPIVCFISEFNST